MNSVPKNRRSKLRLVMYVVILAVLLYVTYSYHLMGSSSRKMADLPSGAHWTLEMAYYADGVEADSYGFNLIGWVTTVPSDKSIELDDSEPFAFQWTDYDGPSQMDSFTLREDGTAKLTKVNYYESEEDGEIILMPEFIDVEFQPSDLEIQALRTAIIDAELGTAPRKTTRAYIYDGLQWEMYLRVDGQTKFARFSNAVPEKFRDLVVTIYRDVCAKHATEIDKVEKKKGWPELTGIDEFKE